MKKLYTIIFSLLTTLLSSLNQATVICNPNFPPNKNSLLFNFNNSDEKHNLNERLKQSLYPWIVEYCTFKDIDFSDLYLRKVIVNEAKFIQCNFSNTDLRDININIHSELINCDLSNAILYHPDPNASKEELQKNGFRIKDWDPESLICQYSDVVKQMDKFSGDSLRELEDKAKRITHFFCPLHLNLSHKSFKDFNLRNINLIHCNLNNINLMNADLQNANLGYANLQGSNLSGANLQNANLQSANLQRANLSGANLKNAYLYGVLISTNLKGVNLSGANLENANLYDTNLEGANLIRANLKSANLGRTKLKGVKLKDANLRNAYLLDVNLEGANLKGAQLQKAEINRFTLPDYSDHDYTEVFNLWVNGIFDQKTGCQILVDAEFDIIKGVDKTTVIEGILSKKQMPYQDLREIDLQNQNLSKFDFHGSNLGYAKLQGSNLQGANLKSTELSNAQLENANLSDANLEGSYLTGANLKDTNLMGAHLKDAKLDCADLINSDLRNADLQNADLLWANLEGAKLGGAKLSLKYNLPNDCKDEDFLEIYSNCSDLIAKAQLEMILKAKKIILETKEILH